MVNTGDRNVRANVKTNLQRSADQLWLEALAGYCWDGVVPRHCHRDGSVDIERTLAHFARLHGLKRYREGVALEWPADAGFVIFPGRAR